LTVIFVEISSLTTLISAQGLSVGYVRVKFVVPVAAVDPASDQPVSVVRRCPSHIASTIFVGTASVDPVLKILSGGVIPFHPVA
jgi:hypothetical protein